MTSHRSNSKPLLPLTTLNPSLFDSLALRAYLSGGAMMGVGDIFAGGCNIGQGLTGAATLSLQSLLALAGILPSMWLILQRLQRTTTA